MKPRDRSLTLLIHRSVIPTLLDRTENFSSAVGTAFGDACTFLTTVELRNDHSISLIIKQAQTIANPLHAIELKLLIETRLQDLAKLKELTLSERASDDTLEEIMRLETALHQALARCHLFMENREMYGKFVIHKHMLRFNETIDYHVGPLRVASIPQRTIKVNWSKRLYCIHRATA
ncbi:uncharacterized protein LOC111250217 isoform X3 [Varroa destructor]|uniref:Uncharacterized protein n=1 Tax=Varroa destructor TaxID=109461 RepID=A0A7M7MA03_VARDE|nr:uncharacterized protein LOC111250217 isoform X3 [Varroa destructor]